MVALLLAASDAQLGGHRRWAFAAVGLASLDRPESWVFAVGYGLWLCLTDRRARIIAVTPAGARLVAQGHQIADRVHGEVLDALPTDQRNVLTSALSALVTGVLAEPVTSERPVRRARTNTVH